MMNLRRIITRTAIGSGLLLSAAGCSDEFVRVTNPNVIDAATVDPAAGATTLALSVQQNWSVAYGWMSLYGAWFSEEANVSDTFPTRNEFGFRTITDLNTSLNADVWTPLSRVIASAKTVLDLELPGPATNINISRAATFRGYAMLQMATDFCSGTFSDGPELTTAQMLDSAIVWLSKGYDVGKANATTDGIALSNAALVARARAKLQKGDNAGAAADAALVPAGFQFNMRYTDDAGNRARLSNYQWQYSFDRGSISVAPWYRQNDPRVPYRSPGSTTANPQDTNIPGGFYQQIKFPDYASPVRLASKLEADYIAAEASGNTQTQLALIAARRTAAGAAAYAGSTDAVAVKTELFNQRALDFYLEGRRVADMRRSPASISNTTPAGAEYFKPGYGMVGRDVCYPIPRAETDNNKNFKK